MFLCGRELSLDAAQDTSKHKPSITSIVYDGSKICFQWGLVGGAAILTSCGTQLLYSAIIHDAAGIGCVTSDDSVSNMIRSCGSKISLLVGLEIGSLVNNYLTSQDAEQINTAESLTKPVEAVGMFAKAYGLLTLGAFIVSKDVQKSASFAAQVTSLFIAATASSQILDQPEK